MKHDPMNQHFILKANPSKLIPKRVNHWTVTSTQVPRPDALHSDVRFDLIRFNYERGTRCHRYFIGNMNCIESVWKCSSSPNSSDKLTYAMKFEVALVHSRLNNE